MAKKIISLMLIFMFIFTVGCASKEVKTEKQNVKDKLKVYASIYPMYDFAKNIGKDKIELHLMIPPGAEPHDWEPTAKLMAELENADVFIYNGVMMEPWADKLLDTIDNKKLIVVKASENVELLKVQDYVIHEREEKNHYRGEYDPHVWLDPIRAMKQAENIKNAFIKADYKNKDFYEKNFKEFAEKLKALDEKYKYKLSKVKNREIVVSHAAFGYMANRYGLIQIPIRGLNPEEEPSVAKLSEIADIMKDKKIKYIYFETLTNPKLAEVLAREVGAKTAVLNPIGGLTKEEMDSGKDYLKTMEENLETLVRTLGE
ncbi:metal ABC transporter substrate-binding protein [Caloranaerobacter sp. DY30410]|uniref:metal ABC transporter substrate-binding protein n=1 Tax=Caloranaerobacter sp. DY30410 TaxID=3238305 RepID=UPI003D067BCF